MRGAPTSPPVAERRGHPFITYDMIFDIPKAIGETLRRNEERVKEVASRLEDRQLIYLTGCGTAYFAAMLGAQFFPRGDGGLRSLPTEAFELFHYGYPLDEGKAVLGISHRESRRPPLRPWASPGPRGPSAWASPISRTGRSQGWWTRC